MKNDYFSQLLAKPDAIVKDAEGFKTVIFNETIDAETITVSVSKADAADLLTFRLLNFAIMQWISLQSVMSIIVTHLALLLLSRRIN